MIIVNNAVAFKILVLLLFMSPGLQAQGKIQTEIAFLPDIHFHDVFATFENGEFTGIPRQDGRNAIIRSMRAQLHSTRLFNENYFALNQALEQLAQDNVRLIVLPGDFTDDGQPLHVRGLMKMLTSFQEKHDMRFFITNGNHDPVRPQDTPGGEPDFLNKNGQEVPVYSTDHNKCLSKQKPENLICADDVGYAGYQSLIEAMPDMGFYPSKRDLFWATPFSTYSHESYQYARAELQSPLANRRWRVCNNSIQPVCAYVIDSSYVVEPVEGVWLLAIDANVYVPEGENGELRGFSGSGNQGYNGVVRYKPQLLQWIKKIASEARALNKELVAFSHFPMAPFYDGQEKRIQQLLGEDAFQMVRSPTKKTVNALLDTGITFHVGGHMHINDTQTIVGNNGRSLLNIQAPSLAAYRPAYKVLTLSEHSPAILRTVRVDRVTGFDTLFPHYQQELRYQTEHSELKGWQAEILSSASYRQFADYHLRELARMRFVPEEWGVLDGKLSLHQQVGWDRIKTLIGNEKMRQHWLTAEGLTQVDFSWTMLDLLHDVYRYRNAGALANEDIPAARDKSYQLLLSLLNDVDEQNRDPAHRLLLQILNIYVGLKSGENDDRFSFELGTGKILNQQ
ncbi:metallophosphoesterase [Lacimicrobium alkaliphilum]|uniref:Metallophosphoesterase n=2 Tax=Lacimicrobium alkaliphilum TaxID=1526571 RepID=A0ABQ1QXV3_9ALTE|nr:metallophosphoesterase [Lacimicrobium alkaliphilum]